MKEVDGGGYGLVQWTPKQDLINACSVLGLSPYTSGDVQIQVIIHEVLNSPPSVAQWYSSSAFISHYYNSGATVDMVGITGQEFLDNSMGWEPDKLAVLFMSAYERPSYEPNINHFSQRQSNALAWYDYMGGTPPPPPPPPIITTKKSKFPWVLYVKKLRNKRLY